MTTSTTKRKTSPRKAAARQDSDQNGRVNGHSGTELPAPEPFVERSTEEKAAAKAKEVIVHPYGTKAIYVFRPKSGAYPIVFPHISEISADSYFFWKIYELNEMFQAFEWMKQAQVPRDIQARVMQLDDEEKAAFFAGWFSAMTAPQQGVSPPGES